MQRHTDGARGLDDDQRWLLHLLASGAPIADIGAELGYSRRSTYRAMSRLFDALGVANRDQAVHKAASQQLID